MDAGGELDQWSHILFLSNSPLRINFGIAGPEEAKNRAGRGVLRLGQIRLNVGEFEKISPSCQLKLLPTRIADSSSINAVSLSSARPAKRFPLSRCASAIQIVRPQESTAAT